MGFLLGLKAFTAAVLGGIGNAFGSLLAGFALGLVMEVSTWPLFFGGVPTRVGKTLSTASERWA